MADAHRGMGAGEELKIPCPHCKRGIPCGVLPKKNRRDILLRIVDFQMRLREKKEKDPLSSIIEDILVEISNLRMKESGLRGYHSDAPKYLPPGYVPPIACPNCNKNIPCNASGRKNQRDIIDRIKELKTRLTEKKGREPLYVILEDALVEIGRLRARIESLSGRK